MNTINASFKAFMISLIKGYRNFISPLSAPCCRFHPSCSEYALGAIQNHGLRTGVWLAIKRIMKCHPLHPGGYDPVPPAKDGHTGLNIWNKERS